jgi:hypothetical protein
MSELGFDSGAEYDAAPLEGVGEVDEGFADEGLGVEADEFEGTPDWDEIADAEQRQLAALQLQEQIESDKEYIDQASRGSAVELAQLDAWTANREEAYAEAFLNEVARAGVEFGVRDEQAIARATASVMETEQAWWNDQLAAGFSPAEMSETMGSPEFLAARQEEIAAQLGVEHYQAVTSRTKMGAWRQQQDRNAQDALALGLQPERSIFDSSPSLQRMAERMAEREGRLAEQKAIVAAHQAGWQLYADRNRKALEAEWERKNGPRTRKVINR